MKQEAPKHSNLKTDRAGFPVLGLNDNLDFMGKQLHVQTESTGSPVARIVTQVFCKGKVIMSRESGCPSEAPENGGAGKMREFMRAQHFQVIQNISDKQARLLNSR
jgi:hypothetical protein